MMNPKVKIGIIAAVSIAVVGTIAYFILRKPTVVPPDNTGADTTTTNSNTSSTTTNSGSGTGTTVAPSSLPSDWVNFDWIGNQSAYGNRAGVHCYPKSPDGTQAGSKVEIKVASGDSSYNGIYDVFAIGADDGTYTESMVTIDRPTTGKAATGQLRLVA